MKNIENAITIINENNGTASLDEIFDAYIRKWHVLPVPENKQKIKGTLELYDGNKVFYDKETELWSTEKSKQDPTSKPLPVHSSPSDISINWDADMKDLLEDLNNKLNPLLSGTKFEMKRNPKESQPDLDFFYDGGSDRMGQLWPKKRYQLFDFCIRVEYVEKLRMRMKLPQDFDIKPGRYSGFRDFKKISLNDVVEIIKELAKL